MAQHKSDTQRLIDTFYWAHRPCCAGCDWWAWANSVAGNCTRSAPVCGTERASLLGISGCSLAVGAGHVITTRDHHCGEFRDNFDWSSLPRAYLVEIGATP